jgi:hypothetical protein
LELDFRLLMVRNNLVVCMFHMARILNLDFKLLKARNYLTGCSNLKAHKVTMVCIRPLVDSHPFLGFKFYSGSYYKTDFN